MYLVTHFQKKNDNEVKLIKKYSTSFKSLITSLLRHKILKFIDQRDDLLEILLDVEVTTFIEKKVMLDMSNL